MNLTPQNSGEGITFMGEGEGMTEAEARAIAMNSAAVQIARYIFMHVKSEYREKIVSTRID
jgi:hypothetical protein